MPKKFISIQDASEISNKSIQTIRRAIKSKKLGSRKQRTPQGFNYMVEKESLCTLYRIKLKEDAPKVEASAPKATAIPHKEVKNKDGEYITTDDFRQFTKVLDKMVNQHTDERQNFLRLVNTLQDKIFVLENQMNLLREPQKRWYQVWK
ncbi:hypothetical protein KJ632_02085 [Patescibacteria group bacterium]|nr:hypothetical protein [Patescibacteria group bacterium]